MGGLHDARGSGDGVAHHCPPEDRVLCESTHHHISRPYTRTHMLREHPCQCHAHHHQNTLLLSLPMEIQKKKATRMVRLPRQERTTSM
jgi:hypothetical protein